MKLMKEILEMDTRRRASRHDIRNPQHLSLLIDIEVDGVDRRDYPDFADAYISFAIWKDTMEELTDEELDYLNSEHSDFVYDHVMDSIH